MTLDTAKFAAIVETAKAKTTDRRWLAAIEKAVAGVVSGWWIITELADCVAITTETGNTYFANGVCQCAAYRNGQPCKHRALARLIELYRERETDFPAVSPAPEAEAAEVYCSCCGAPSPVEYDVCPSCGTEGEWMTEEEFFDDEVAASSRANLIAEIENIWPRFAPGVPLYTELLARFGKSDLDMLDEDSLRRVRLAIAM